MSAAEVAPPTTTDAPISISAKESIAAPPSLPVASNDLAPDDDDEDDEEDDDEEEGPGLAYLIVRFLSLPPFDFFSSPA